MQKQVISQNPEVEYSPFGDYFEVSGEDFTFDYNVPEAVPIESLHYHDALEFGLCLEGSSVFWIDGMQYPCGKGSVSVIFPQQIHKARSIGTEKNKWFFLTLRGTEAVQKQIQGSPCGTVTNEASIVRLMQEIYRECSEREENYIPCTLGLCQALLARYQRLSTTAEIRTLGSRVYIKRLQEVLQYISLHYMEQLDTKDLSEKCFVHESTLRTWFQKALGMSPKQYLNQTRIAHACAMLCSSDLPIAYIAAEAGFQSLSSFNRRFHSVCGVSPREYRSREIEKT